MEPQIVVVEPKVVTARVLRPWTGFETLYQGVNAIQPVSFYEILVNPADPAVWNDWVRDPMAGEVGYDPDLERYVPVPFGSRVTAWIPYCVCHSVGGIVEQVYDYTFHWRIRNVEKYLRELETGATARGYHSARRGGFEEPLYPGAVRYAVPSATNSIIIEQSESLLSYQQVSHVRRERLRVISAAEDTAVLAIYPDGKPAIRQQGVYDNGNNAGAPAEIGQSDLYLKVDFDAAGDELLIQANRADAFDQPRSVWDFDPAAPDAAFSNVYGVNQGGIAHVQPTGSGIYLLYGSAP